MHPVLVSKRSFPPWKMASLKDDCSHAKRRWNSFENNSRCRRPNFAKFHCSSGPQSAPKTPTLLSFRTVAKRREESAFPHCRQEADSSRDKAAFRNDKNQNQNFLSSPVSRENSINPLNAKEIYLSRTCPIYRAGLVILELEVKTALNAKIKLFRG
jgi:hypothetical protein